MAASNKYRKQLLTSDKARQLHDNREKMEEEVRRLTEKVQILQAEVYSRQTEKARIEFNAARVQLKERKMQTVKMNPRDLNLKIKQELETYMEGTEQSINAFEQHLNTVKQQSLTIHVVNGKHALRIRVDPLATFGHLLDEVRLFWNVPDERVFVLRDEHGNYWSPLSNVIQQFSALRQYAVQCTYMRLRGTRGAAQAPTTLSRASQEHCTFVMLHASSSSCMCHVSEKFTSAFWRL